MEWHNLPEIPEPNVEVIAETEGLLCDYAVLKYHPDAENRWLHCCDMNTSYACWEDLTEGNVKRWAYINK